MNRASDTRRPALVWGAIAFLAILGFGWRVGYTAAAKGNADLTLQSGDQIYYSKAAEALTTGRGFVHPYDRSDPHAADHPPLTAVVAGPATLLPDGVLLAQRLTMGVIGSATVVALGALARHLAGDAAAVATAAIAAVHPGLWLNDTLIMAESIGALTVVGVVAAALWTHRHPGRWTAVAAGAAVGLAGLARPEALLLGPLVVAPLILRPAIPQRTRFSRRMGWLVAAGFGCLMVLTPWVTPNLVRFEHPVTMSTNDGLTLLGSNCDDVYGSGGAGLWSLACVADIDSSGLDQSEVSAAYRERAIENMGSARNELPRVAAIRVARVWSLYKPGQMVAYNRGEGRPLWAGWAAVWGFWAISIGAVATWPFWRDRMPAWIVFGPVAAVTATAAAFYGLTRFRVTAEVVLVLAAGVGLGVLCGRLRERWTERSPDP